ncbi:MAG: GMC family oxidoreductase N-terminal domain-containing protein, partial [Gammaproteobacteria bacterium]
MTTPATDVVVIGAGAGGGACAWALTAAGLHVTVLEAGPAYDPGRDYRVDTPVWELDGFPHKVAPGGRQTVAPLQPLAAGFAHLRARNALHGALTRGERRSNWGYQHVAGVGGSTLHFTGEAHRLHPRAFTLARDHGVGADWPLDYAALEPWYEQAEQIVGVAAATDDGRTPRRRPPPLPPHAPSYASQRLGAGARALGLGWVANPLAVLSAPWRGRPPCNYCGQCARGCPRRDKGSVDLTFIADARASGRCTIVSEASVTNIVRGERDRVRGVEYHDAAGALQRLAARAVVVACGAVETPRLLLNCDGLGNESGQVGRHFLETLYYVVSAEHPEPLGSHRGHPADSICWDFNAPDAIPGIPGGCRFTPGMAETDLTGPLAYARRVVGGWGRAHHAAMRARFGHVLTVAAIGETLPHARAFVDLDADARDARGLPRARINAWLGDSDLGRLDFMARTAR